MHLLYLAGGGQAFAAEGDGQVPLELGISTRLKEGAISGIQ